MGIRWLDGQMDEGMARWMEGVWGVEGWTEE